MKTTALASLALALLLFAQPASAEDLSEDTSEVAGYASLSTIAAPLLLTGAAAGTAAGASAGVVTIVGAGGEPLSELTEAAFDELGNASRATYDTAETASTDTTTAAFKQIRACEGCIPRIRVNRKEIPLVVRKDYLHLNQKVKTDE